LALPACVAWMAQVPAPASVTEAADTVQTDAVVDAKATGRPEDAVAVSVNGGAPICWLERAAKAMVWAPGVTVRFWSTGVAAA